MTRTMSLSTCSRPHFSSASSGFFEKPKFDCSGKELFASVNAAGGQQFLGANQTHQLGLLGADQVLPAFSASSGEVGRAHIAAARKVGDDGGVFVVGMGAQHEQAPQSVELVECLCKFGGAGERGGRRGLGAEREADEGAEQQHAGGPSAGMSPGAAS